MFIDLGLLVPNFHFGVVEQCGWCAFDWLEDGVDCNRNCGQKQEANRCPLV